MHGAPRRNRSQSTADAKVKLLTEELTTHWACTGGRALSPGDQLPDRIMIFKAATPLGPNSTIYPD